MIKAPINLLAVEACTLPVAGLTAWNALHYASVTSGGIVLLHDTGGVSIMGLLGGSEMTINALSLMERHATIRGMEVGNKQDFQDMNQAILFQRGSANEQHDIIKLSIALLLSMRCEPHLLTWSKGNILAKSRLSYDSIWPWIELSLV